MKERPGFDTIKTFDEFIQYYWYLSDLQTICKSKGIDHKGNKIELNERIQLYFQGNIVKPQKGISIKKTEIPLTLNMKLLEGGFAMRSEYREFFGKHLGVKNFHFTADMAATIKKVRQTKDYNFTIQDLMDVYTGKSTYARYDTSSCQWNQFVKDFCADPTTKEIPQKMKLASALWTYVRNSTKEKRYTPELLEEYQTRKKE